MRRFIFVIAVLLSVMAFFAACTFFQDGPPDIVTDFSATATVTEAESSLVCEVSHTKEGVASVTITKPETLKGLCFKWLGGAYSIEYNDLFCQSNTEYLPQQSFASAIVNVLTACADQQSLTVKERKDSQTTFSGRCKSGDFIIVCDDQTGIIQSVEIEKLSLNVKFKDQKKFL